MSILLNKCSVSSSSFGNRHTPCKIIMYVVKDHVDTKLNLTVVHRRYAKRKDCQKEKQRNKKTDKNRGYWKRQQNKQQQKHKSKHHTGPK